jgi:hypothetical protein
MEIIDNERKEVKKKLQHLVKQLYQDNNDMNEAYNDAVMLVLSSPRFKGILTSIVSQAVAEAVARIIILNGMK